ncbi:MAG: glycine betaine ABC transporter substrate-binding protein [Rhizomicrobium sp.]
MHRDDAPGRAAVLAQMSDWMKKTYGIRLMGNLGFENAYAFVLPRAKADALHINSLADLAAYAPRMKIGGDFEIFSRPEWRAVVKGLWPEIRRPAAIPGEPDVPRAGRRRRRRHLGLFERWAHRAIRPEGAHRSEGRAAAL